MAYVFLSLDYTLSLVSSNAIHLPANVISVSLQMNKIPLCMYHIYLVHSSVKKILDCLHSLVIVNRVIIYPTE